LNTSRRMVALILFISIVLLLGMFFWPFILNEVIQPTSLVIWLLLRIFVLSIGQQSYWIAIIFVAVFCLIRILPQEQIPAPPGNFHVSNPTLKTIEYWRSLCKLTKDDVRGEVILKRELIQLLLAFYSSKQHTSANFGIYEALQRGEIPLPEHIHTFLFLNEPRETGRPFKKLMHSIRNSPTKWLHRWTGEETAEYYQIIDEVLSFLEISLEMKNDDGKFNPTKH
jgi:hypothetical protein